LPEEIEVGDWIGLTVAAPILVVDSLTVGGMLVERSIGRFPDGSGRTRVLSEATPGQPNRWEEPLTVVATPEEEIYYAGEEVRVDLWVTNRWRDTIAVDLEVEVVCPGGVWCLEAPIDTVSIPVLAAGDSAFASFEDSIPELMAPENEGRYDIVFTPVESKGQPLEPGVATIYVLGESFGTAMINEFCASNQSVVADEDGEFEDWVEIVNAADSTISTANLYLSDDAEDEPFKWALPSLDLEPSEHLLIWLDNEPTEGPLHASFKLDREGEEIGLIQETADSVLVLDRIPFGYQEKDWSYGRYPDSARNWELFGWPTPAATNLDPVLRY
ncbi:MAG: hypothetical protein CME06_02385, partial [Gemmatimonadetes bacterium]|nr:hypothetical protein [Gemmatimonadota bacterium]